MKNNQRLADQSLRFLFQQKLDLQFKIISLTSDYENSDQTEESTKEFETNLRSYAAQLKNVEREMDKEELEFYRDGDPDDINGGGSFSGEIGSRGADL